MCGGDFEKTAAPPLVTVVGHPSPTVHSTVGAGGIGDPTLITPLDRLETVLRPAPSRHSPIGKLVRVVVAALLTAVVIGFTATEPAPGYELRRCNPDLRGDYLLEDLAKFSGTLVCAAYMGVVSQAHATAADLAERWRTDPRRGLIGLVNAVVVVGVVFGVMLIVTFLPLPALALTALVLLSGAGRHHHDHHHHH